MNPIHDRHPAMCSSRREATVLNECSLVKSLKDVPGKGVKKGDVGTIVHCYVEPREGYEVEFLDEDGYTLGVLTYERHELEPVSETRC